MSLFFFLIEWNQLFGSYFSCIFLIQDPLRKQVVYFSVIKLMHTFIFLIFLFVIDCTCIFLFLRGRVLGTVIILWCLTNSWLYLLGWFFFFLIWMVLSVPDNWGGCALFNENNNNSEVKMKVTCCLWFRFWCCEVCVAHKESCKLLWNLW